MALVKCNECDVDISDKASTCPNCGAPTVDPAVSYTASPQALKKPRKVGWLLGLGVFVMPFIFAWLLFRQGHSAVARVISFGWMLALGLLIGFGEPVVEDGPVAELPHYTAQELARAYYRNTVAADQRFKGKRFKVTGVVNSIDTDLFGTPGVTMRGGVDAFLQPQFSLRRSERDFAASLSTGMTITLICTGQGDVLKMPISDYCVAAD